MSDLPDPLTPPECDLRDYPWMPLDVRRLLTSETWMDGPAEGKVAALSLMCEAWCQLPAGSLPTNERILAHLSQTGSAWPKIRTHALRNWVLCSDGRLYHPVVAEKAREAWALKLAQKARTEAARKARAEKRAGMTTDNTPSSVTEPVTCSVTENATVPVTDTVTGSTRQDQTRQDQTLPPPVVPPLAANAPATPPPTRATRLSVGWEPGETGRAFALERGLDPDEVLAQFRDYWLAKARDNTKLDWGMTWQVWCRTEAGRRQQRPQPRPSRPSQDERVLRAAGLWPDDEPPTIDLQALPVGGLLQ